MQATLQRARRIGIANGLRYVYTGNVRDRAGGVTHCPSCNAEQIVRDGYRILAFDLDAGGRCGECGTPVAGHFETTAGSFGSRRIPLRVRV